MRPWRKTFAAAAAAVVLSACGHVIPGRLTGDGKDFDFAKPCSSIVAPEAQPIEVRYLGAGNYYLRWRDEAILLGASFSRPNAFRAGFLRLVHDEPRIQEALKGLPGIRAVFAGHSHYDHLGDLPVIADAMKGFIYVNAHGARMLAPYDEFDDRVVTIAPGKEITSGPFHVRVLASGHAPQLCPWNIRLCRYGDGPIAEEWKTKWPTRRLKALRGGDTLAFAIDLLDEDRTSRYRIYFNDSAAPSPLGQTEGPFDLAILTAAQWTRVRDYPRDLLQVIQPRHVVVSHWENFFTTEKTQFVFRLNPEGFIETADRLAIGDGKPVNDVCGAKNDNWTMPAPGASMFFIPTPRKSS